LIYTLSEKESFGCWARGSAYLLRKRASLPLSRAQSFPILRVQILRVERIAEAWERRTLLRFSRGVFRLLFPPPFLAEEDEEEEEEEEPLESPRAGDDGDGDGASD